MNSFNDLESLWKYATDDIKKTMKTNGVEKMKDIEQDVIKEVVLDSYNPKYYDRRSENGSNDGLISRDNMKAYPSVDNKKELVIEMTNDTKGNREYPNSTNGYIDEIIEYGNGYTWTGSDIYLNMPFPRPFTEETQRRLDESGIVEQIIKDSSTYEIE